MDKKLLLSTFTVNKEIIKEDTRFLNVTIDVLHTGKNFNKSFFEKDIVNNCIDSIKNTPILGYIKYDYDNDKKDFKGHEYIFKKTVNGIEETYIGRAYGVIPESCNSRWITKICDDGIEREFLQVDGLMWTKFDATDIMNNDITKSQSMELELSSIEGEEDENGIFKYTNFRFDGCCILGDDVEPAMINSKIEVQFSINNYIKQIQEELNDKFTLFNKAINENNKGGIIKMSNSNFSQTVKEQLKDISSIVLNHEKVTDKWGYEYSRFYLEDIQDEEIIVVDCKDNYNYFSFPLTFEGDKPIIDFEAGKRVKIQYTDYEEGEEPIDNPSLFSIGQHISSIEANAEKEINKANIEYEKVKAELDEANGNFEKMKEELNEIKPNYEILVKEDEKRKEEEIKENKTNEFSKYEHILGNQEEFKELIKNSDEMSVDEVKTNCALLYSKFTLNSNNEKGISAKLPDQGKTDSDNVVIDSCYGKLIKYR